MIQFLKNIEMSARLVNVTNFRFNAAVDKNDQMLSLNFSLVAPYLKVQSTAVTDDALKLDLSNGDFVSFINKVKDFKYYKQLSADQQSDARKKAEEQKMEEVTEATPSAPSTAEPSPTSAQ